MYSGQLSAERIRAAVRHEHGLAVVPNEPYQVGLLLVAQLEITLRVEHDRVKIVEILAVPLQFLLAHQFHVGAEPNIEQSGALADLGHGEHGVRH